MNNPIRLALVITELEVGGAEKCLVELATRIDRKRFDPVVYSLAQRPAPERDLLVRRLEEAGITTHFLGLRRWSEFRRGVRELADALRRQRAELVQSLLFHANVLAAHAARKAGVRATATGIRVADPRWWRAMAERWATRSANAHVCVSNSVAAHSRRYGFPAHKLVVIPNAIDVSVWAKASPADLSRFGVPSGRRAIVYVGRLDRQKNLATLLRAMPQIALDLPEHDLVLVGEGPERFALQQQAEQLNVAEKVHFAGWQRDVPGILAAADLLVLPSAWEGMPNAVLEAMAAGKPVVATLAEGVRELLGDLAAEQTVPLADGGEQFAERVAAIVRTPRQANDLGRQNQERARACFSFDAMLAAYERLYFQLATQ